MKCLTAMLWFIVFINEYFEICWYTLAQLGINCYILKPQEVKSIFVYDESMLDEFIKI